MKTLRNATLCLASVFALSAPVQAQDRVQSPGAGLRGARAEVPAGQTVDFSDEIVTGGVVSPEGATGRVLRRQGGISLLRVRENFMNEMFKSVENF